MAAKLVSFRKCSNFVSEQVMKKSGLFVLALLCVFCACAKMRIRQETVRYEAGGQIMNGHLVYDEMNRKRRPAVLVVHEWWGLNDYPKQRALMLAKLGYVAFCVDMYGNGAVATMPDEAKRLSGAVYKDPALMLLRMQAALRTVRGFGLVDTTKIAAIGYCFGGSVLLNTAKMGLGIDGVVSFHGGLKGQPADAALLKAKILVCHGAADASVTDRDSADFRRELDSIHADHVFKTYAGATHAFTNPATTENGIKFGSGLRYDAAADKKSWKHMRKFLKRVFKGQVVKGKL